MTIQKQLSHLSFAAIMLVFAALPALAQTASVDNQVAVAITSSVIESQQVVALRKDRLSIPTKESAIAVTAKQPSFSLTQFMKSATEPAVIGDSTVFNFATVEKPRNDFNETSSSKINFVPSRGPKLPWQQ